MSVVAAKQTVSRERALAVLLECHAGEANAHDLLESMQAESPLSEEDAGLAAELVLGVLRRRLTCEHIAAHFYRGRWEGLRMPIRLILALAVYQLCFLERVPDYAAVDQAVRAAKRYGRGAGELVNAILRKLGQSAGDIRPAPSQPSPRRYLPIDESRGRVFADDIFPDPERRPLDFLIAATSHSPWLVERWHRRFKPALCRQVCESGLRRPALVLRPNPLRTTTQALVDGLRGQGLRAYRVEGSDAVGVADAPPVTSLEEFQRGLCQPQDSTAMIPLRLAGPRAGDCVLDLCAGSGTKSTQAAELMQNEGLVIATDANSARLSRIEANTRRLGLTIVRAVPLEGLEAALTEAGRVPDLIVIDAPCSNTAVLARRPEARYRASAKNLISLIQVQRDLLSRALELAGPRTRLLYSTCSLEREENEAQVEWFCEYHDGWRVSEQSFTLPDRHRDGGFAAVLQR